MKKVFIGMSGGVDSTAAAIDVGTARELSNVAANFPVRRNFSAGGSSRKVKSYNAAGRCLFRF